MDKEKRELANEIRTAELAKSDFEQKLAERDEKIMVMDDKRNAVFLFISFLGFGTSVAGS